MRTSYTNSQMINLVSNVCVALHEKLQFMAISGFSFNEDINPIINRVFQDHLKEIRALIQFNHTNEEIIDYLLQFIKYKKVPKYLALVDNNLKGWETIIKLKNEYKEKGKLLRLRGRGKNRLARCEAAGLPANRTLVRQDLPIKVADKIAVYVR